MDSVCTIWDFVLPFRIVGVQELHVPYPEFLLRRKQSIQQDFTVQLNRKLLKLQLTLLLQRIMLDRIYKRYMVRVRIIRI